MNEQDKIKELQAQMAVLQRERDAAVSAINMYRLTLQWVYKQYPDLDPLVKASILSDLQSYLNGPLVHELRVKLAMNDDPDSFDRHIFVEHADQPVDLETVWDNFIYHFAMKFGYFVKDKKGMPLNNPPIITMKNFIGSMDAYKKEFLEANT